ncbi:histone acetyltransferase HAC1-like [Thalictrum thalictroides]|uniref:histone acetyltransferase n=1 Tax=Thalictrum thalictroides TaxID=46969 RepID=A0A7J6UWN7_THATH|nr:histone acetyltransferase HAC1-like [Thalictrum thalictroides]
MMDASLPFLSFNNATHQQQVHQPRFQEEDPHMHPQDVDVIPLRRMFGRQSSNGNASLPFLSSNNATHQWVHQPRLQEEDPHMHPQYVDMLPLRRMFGRQSSNGNWEDMIQPSRKRKMMDASLPFLSSNNATHQQLVHQPRRQEEAPHTYPQFDVLPFKRDFGGQSSDGPLEDILQPSRERKMMGGSLPYLLPSNDTFVQLDNNKHQPCPPEEVKLQPPQKISKMVDGSLGYLSSKDNFQQGDVDMIQPHHPAEDPHMQQLDVLPFDGDFDGQYLTGLLDDMIGPLPEQPNIGKHPSIPNLYDNETSQASDDVMQLLDIPHQTPIMDEGLHVSVLVDNETSQALDDVMQLLDIPHQTPIVDEGLHVSVLVDNEMSQASDDVMQLLDIPHQTPIVDEGLHVSILVDNEKSQASDDVMQLLDIPHQTPIVDEGLHVSVFVEKEDIGKRKIKCMTDLFTAEQVEEHIKNLRQQFGQSNAEVESNQATSQCMNEHGCQICTKEELSFKPPSVYCSWCRFRILEKKTYYTALDRDMLHYVCTTCYTKFTGKSVAVNGLSISKSRLKKNTNSEGTTEPWVQCTKCEGWQHQICALFNDIENKDRDTEYLCPNCYIQEIKGGERLPLPQDAVPGAKDLPRTSLSDYIENRLFARLQKERQERADREGKKMDEVPGAEDLVVRVVLSIEKKTKVKQGFLDAFAEKNYPEEFPYKSKAILLFQNIEGVEVCLFAMYVQEYGLECASPNQRCVYLSYLDSVKYFTPDIKAVNGDDLRTFVYHELLIGYLDYCKKQGFLTCYIWTCPPLKGDNYIFHCHPENQKAPNSVRLRKWYRSMLQKAKKENVVVSTTNLYDHFFKARPQFKSSVTLLPYFDGDYWPLLAEEKIRELKQEEYKRNEQSKGEKELSRKVLKTRGCANLSEDADIDNLLMQKLGDYIQPNKENFLMVQLHYICRHCCQPVLSGKPWICNDCKDFPLCERMIRTPVGVSALKRNYKDLTPTTSFDTIAKSKNEDHTGMGNRVVFPNAVKKIKLMASVGLHSDGTASIHNHA